MTVYGVVSLGIFVHGKNPSVRGWMHQEAYPHKGKVVCIQRKEVLVLSPAMMDLGDIVLMKEDTQKMSYIPFI